MRFNAVLLLVVASLFTSNVFAKIDTNLKGDDLVQAVIKATKDGHHSLSYNAARKELFGLRFQHATGELENTARLRQAKRDVARALTVVRERGIDVNKELSR